MFRRPHVPSWLSPGDWTDHLVDGVHNEAFANKAVANKWFNDNEEGFKGGWHTAQRLKELDGEGVAPEVAFPDADADADADSGCGRRRQPDRRAPRPALRPRPRPPSRRRRSRWTR
ncbi:hypothetical protein [Streptomyces sp. NPDC001820]|uniref:hypothetical protein n=1 Tax=Streptomyces sp. NPDC001820 TaxID=3364613 RepID=UPI00369B86FA